MSIPAYVQPTADFGSGYVVQPSDWNNNMDGIANYFNTTVKPAIDALQAGISVAGAQGFVQGRLSLTSGSPVTTSDVTGAANLYFNPMNGNQVGLWTGTVWQLNTVSAPVQLSLASILKWVNYDVFLFNNNGTLTLEAVQWFSIAATNNPSAGSNVVININNTGNFLVGDWVTVAGGGNTELAVITAISGGVSITVATLANSYTTPTIYASGANGRATALAQQNNVFVKTAATSHLWLGTIRGSGAGVCEDSRARRFCWNAFNQLPRPIYANDSSATWNPSSTNAWVTAHANVTAGTHRTEFVIGNAGQIVDSTYTSVFLNNNGITGMGIGLALNSITAPTYDIMTTIPAANDATANSVRYIGTPAAGFNFLQDMEFAAGVGGVFYGLSSSPYAAGSAPCTFQTGWLNG